MSTMKFFSGNSERPFAVIYLFIYFLFYIDYCFLKKLISLLTQRSSEAIDDSKDGQGSITQRAKMFCDYKHGQNISEKL